MEYWSDASFTSESEDSEDEESDDEIYCPRELDYWAIESFLEIRGPPSAIAYVENMSVVDIRECIISENESKDIGSIIEDIDVDTWKEFWTGIPRPTTRNGRFSCEDWELIGSFCFALCEQILPDVSLNKVRSTIIGLLSFGAFKRNNSFGVRH